MSGILQGLEQGFGAGYAEGRQTQGIEELICALLILVGDFWRLITWAFTVMHAPTSPRTCAPKPTHQGASTQMKKSSILECIQDESCSGHLGSRACLTL